MEFLLEGNINTADAMTDTLHMQWSESILNSSL